MIDQLNEQIQIVKQAREQANQITDALDAAKAKWTADNESLIFNQTNARQLQVEAETKLRELTIEVFNCTGNKVPAQGVAVRIMTKLEYNQNQAFDYAKEHGVALKLDTNAFEKMCKISELRPAFVTSHDEPQATIASVL